MSYTTYQNVFALDALNAVGTLTGVTPGTAWYTAAYDNNWSSIEAQGFRALELFGFSSGSMTTLVTLGAASGSTLNPAQGAYVPAGQTVQAQVDVYNNTASSLTLTLVANFWSSDLTHGTPSTASQSGSAVTVPAGSTATLTIGSFAAPSTNTNGAGSLVNLQINASTAFTPGSSDAFYVDKVEVNLVTVYPAASGDTGQAGGLIGGNLRAGHPFFVSVPDALATQVTVNNSASAFIYACVKKTPVEPDTSGSVTPSCSLGRYGGSGEWRVGFGAWWSAGTWYLEVFQVSGGVATGITSGYFTIS